MKAKRPCPFPWSRLNVCLTWHRSLLPVDFVSRNLSSSLFFAFMSSEAVALSFRFRALARSLLDSSISKLHRTRTKRLRKHVAVAWKTSSMGIWGPDQMTETTPKCDGYTYIHTYTHTYKRNPNAIHDYLSRLRRSAIIPR